MAKKNILKIIEESFRAWYKNLAIILPFIFQTIVSFVIILVSMLLFLKILKVPVADFLSGWQTLQSSTNIISSQTSLPPVFQNILTALQSPGTLVVAIVIGIVALLIYLLSLAYFNGGEIGMAFNYSRTKKNQNLKDMHFFGNKFLGRVFFLNLVIDLALLIVLGGSFLIMLLINAHVLSIILFIIAFLVSIVFYYFSSLSSYIVVCEDSKVWHSIGESFKIIGKNFWAFLGLCAILLVIITLIQLIPFAGYFINLLLMYPLSMLSFVCFIEERK